MVLSGPTIHLCHGYGLFLYHISISAALVAYSTYQWWAGVALVDLQHVPGCTGIRVEPEILPSVRMNCEGQHGYVSLHCYWSTLEFIALGERDSG